MAQTRSSAATVGRRAARRLSTSGGARQESLREHNLALVLGAVRASPAPPSRAELSTVTGLTRPTVSALVDRLLAARMLAELPVAARQGAGRPAVPLRIAGDGFIGYGLEINVNRIGISAVTLSGEVLAEEQLTVANRRRGPEAVLADLVDMARPVIHRTRGGRRCVGIGVSVPGMMSRPADADPRVLLAPNLGWRDVDVLGAVRRSRLLGRSWPPEAAASLGNDADLGARAELALSAHDASFVYLSGEVGLGGALVVDGRHLSGQRGWAGELGHVCVDPDGRPCPCGARGCLETYVGTRALVHDAGVAGRRGPDRVPALVRALGAGRPEAVSALSAAGHRLGVAVAGVINVVDVDEVVLGGPLGLLVPWLAEGVGDELARRVITAGWRPLGVRAASSGTLGAARGAALGALDQVFAEPSRWFPAV